MEFGMTKSALRLYSHLLRLCDNNYWVFDQAFAITPRNSDGVIEIDDLLHSIVEVQMELKKERASDENPTHSEASS